MFDSIRELGSPGDLIVDCDDVLLDWAEGFRLYCRNRLDRDLDPAGPDSWDMRRWIGISCKEEAKRLITDFNAGDGGYFSRLPAFPDAKRALARIHSSGRSIHVVTSCSSDPIVVAQRTENLRSSFGDIFDEVFCLDLGIDKATVLRRFHPGIWVEDNLDNGIAGTEAGHTTFMIRRNHNRKREAACRSQDLTWVHGWDEILAITGL